MPYDCPKIVCESGARFTKYLTTVLRLSSIMPQLPSIYDGHLIYKTSYEERKAFLRYNSLAYRTIVSDSVHKLAYDIPKRTLCTLLRHYRNCIVR